MNQEKDIELRMGKKNLWLIGIGMVVIIIGFASILYRSKSNK